jgi:hypothetical protein
MIVHASMVSRSPVKLFAPQASRLAQARPIHLSRADWIWICAAQLSRLRPDQDVESIVFVAKDLWTDVASFDPVIAAEMEYEAWLAGDRDAACAEPGANPIGQTR